MSDFQVAPDGTWMFPPDDGVSPFDGGSDSSTDTAPSPSREVWEFPPDDGKTPLEELGPAVPSDPSSPSSPSSPSPVVEFPEDVVRAPSLLERAGNWFTDLF